jgi:hypothetical protein
MARCRLLVAAVVVLVTAGCGLGASPGGDRLTADRPSEGAALPGEWMSGAAGFGVSSGEFGAWRGRPVEIVATWADDNVAMTELTQLRPGGEYAGWQGPMDIAIGAIGPGESWRQAAVGAYDARWRLSLSNLRELRGSRAGTTFIRFAHEFNGDWYPWSVNAGNYRAFIDAWRRFRGLQREIFPQARLVFAVNRESFGAGMDWRDMFPGAEYVDLMGVAYFNQFPCVVTQREWDIEVVEKDDNGAPRGLEAHRQFAGSVGLPLAVPEWACDAHQCDSPVYVQNMYDYFRTHAGGGPGEILYESYFNVIWDGDRWRLFGSDRMPSAAERYRELFG